MKHTEHTSRAESAGNTLRSLEVTMLLLLFFALLTMVIMTGAMESGAPDSIQSSQPGTPTVLAMPSVEDPVCNGIIRFHIRANSNTEEDQALKLQVRNHVLAKVQNHLMNCFAQEMANLEMTETRRLELTRQWLEDHMAQIETWAEETVRAEGYSYPVSASLGITWIPDREYDGIYFPSGNYEALTLCIGEGTGQNWWCVLFPPLCLIDCGEELGQARFEAVAGDRVILKSRIMELLEPYRKRTDAAS